MVPVTKKGGLKGHVGPDEIEDGSEGYADSSDESLVEEEANVSDYEGRNPKEAPDVCFFNTTECRKVFCLKGDEALGIERVCGGVAGSCVRAGHGDEGRRVGDVGWYDTIKTFRKVDGMLSTHRSQEEYLLLKAEAKAIRESHLSILTGSPTYLATLQKVNTELGNVVGGKDGDDTFTGWESLEGDEGLKDQERNQDRKHCPPTGKTVPTEARSNRTERKLVMASSEAPEKEGVSADILLAALLTLTDKVEAMERRTLVKDKKRLAKKDDSGTDVSEDSDDTVAKPKSRKKSQGTPKERPRDEASDDVSKDYGRSKPRSATYPSTKSKIKDPKPLQKKVRKYYAVARGYSPGVYKTWEEAKRQVNGFRNAMHKSFKTKAEARAYVDANRQAHEEDWDESPDPSSSESDVTSEEEEPACRRRTRGKVSHPSTDYMAPDPSIGKPKEFFKMPVTDAKSMVNAMSPPGVTDYETRKLLAGATLDAVQLPGRCGTVAENDPGSVAEAIAELAEDKRGEWAGDGPRRDVQWKATNRTSLRAITSHDALQERLSELQGLEGDTYENQVHSFRAILSDLHWSETSILAWSQLNWYQRIGLDTLKNYINLHRHLSDVSLKHGWDYAALSLAHHTTKLAYIRAQAPSRLCCMVRIYIYLRDANQQSFYSEKLQEKRNKEVMGELSSLRAHGGSSTEASCKKCGMGPHPGGTKNCPLKNLSDADARNKVKFVWEQLSKMQKKDWNKILADE